MSRTVLLQITGKVQGVYYRASAKEQAEGLGLRGWVRNQPDGTVQALAHGADDKIESFIDWCRRGPSGAVVTNVSVTETKIPAGAGLPNEPRTAIPESSFVIL